MWLMFDLVALIVLFSSTTCADDVIGEVKRPKKDLSGPKCEDGLVLPVWYPQDNLPLWVVLFRGTIYFLSLMYLFLGVSIVSDRFMGAIEVITSQEREVVIRKKGSSCGQKIKVRVWNETVANLTLMALGSSAPEILLSVIEIAGKNFTAGELGPGTIVGSAAYNLFVIIAICVIVIPDGEVRKIKHLSVFFVTAIWSVFAYIWLYLILAVISEGIVECWEGFLTFMFFPATVLTAYIADRKLKLQKFKKFRLNRHRVIVAAESGDIEVEKEIEEEILEESSITDPHHFAIILRDLKKKHSTATPAELEALAVEELSKRTHKSKAFYRLKANKLAGSVAQTTHPKKEIVPKESIGPRRKGARIFLDPDYYSVLENVGEFEVTVIREGDQSQTITVYYTTEDGTAVAGSDYVGATGTIVFHPGEKQKTIKLEVLDDDIFEEDEHFYLHLTKAVVVSPNGDINCKNAPSIILDDQCTATIVILDDDHCGVFGFAGETVQISENVGVYNLEVIRSSGARGRVRVDYYTQEGSAKYDRHFMEAKGTLIFENNEAKKEIEIQIVEENCYEKNVSFFVHLEHPQEIGNDCNRVQRYDEEIELNEEGKVALNGKPKLGAISKIEVVIKESDEFKNTVNKLVEQEGPSVGFSSWSEQFSNAFRIKPDSDDESEQDAEITWCDYFIHCLTFIWKLLFAFVPPADMYSGYLCFVVSIVFIGLLTAVIGDLASHFGCTVGLKDSVTAVTFVALGTSVPDTFASKVAAIQDSTADNSVGNVTGSNAVNVFLGIGIAWSIASFYHRYHNRDFQVNAGNLAFCVTLYCSEAAVAIMILLIRRSKLIGGELGGPKTLKYLTSCMLFSLWIIYITFTTLEAYGVIEGF